MFKCESDINLETRFDVKIKEGLNLLLSLNEKDKVSGVAKLKKKVKKELDFLNKMVSTQGMKNEHLLSTNLNHFEAIVKFFLNENNVVSVYETKFYEDIINVPRKLCVDIISEGGRKWIKVVARNPKALSQILSGDGDYGQKSIVDHAFQYINCARQNPYLFEHPQVYFIFASGVTAHLKKHLINIGIYVVGEMIRYYSTDDDFNSNDENQEITSSPSRPIDFSEPQLEITTVNLDVSTMIAYVSALTNGNCNLSFKEPLLNQQAEWERKRPVKPVLDNIFQGKSLICCESAFKSFKEIVDTIGGQLEKERAEKLLLNVKVVADVPFKCLKLGGKIKPRSVAIFGTGYHHKALTASANEGFIRASKHQNCEFAVILHESRALTEIKQESFNNSSSNSNLLFVN